MPLYIHVLEIVVRYVKDFIAKTKFGNPQMSYLLTCFFLNRKCKKRQLKSKKVAGFEKDGLGNGTKKRFTV